MKKMMSGSVLGKRLKCFVVLLLISTRVFSQVLTDDQLIDMAYNAYHNSQWAEASIYLYAYIQKRPGSITTDRDYADMVNTACASSFSHASVYVSPKHSLGYSGAILSADQLLEHTNNAIANGDWANASIYSYAYMQKIGGGGGNVDGANNTYTKARSNFLRAIDDYNTAVSSPGSRVHGLNSPPPPLTKPAVHKNFDNFYQAMKDVFNESNTNFANIKGAPFPNNTSYSKNYNSTINVSDPVVSEMSIFQRNNTWAFRFVVKGEASAEEAQFTGICKEVEFIFLSHGMSNFSKTPLAYNNGDVRLTSYQYNASGHKIDIYRTIFGNTYTDEVIIYH